MPVRPRARGGPKSPFGDKSPPNRSVSLTPFSKEILRRNSDRYATSESNLVEVAVRFMRWGDDAAIRAVLAND